MPRMFLVPVGEVEVKDTWHVDGMAATGSRDIVARSVFVPDAARLAHPAADVAARARRRRTCAASRCSRSLRSPRPSRRSGAPVGRSSCSGSAWSSGSCSARPSVKPRRRPRRSAWRTSSCGRAIAEDTMRAAAREMAAHARGETQLSLLDHLQLRVTIAHVVAHVPRHRPRRDGSERRRRPLPRQRAAAHPPRHAHDQRAHGLRRRRRRAALRPGALA